MPGKYLVFEGSDGTGKSTMSGIIYEYLCKKYGDDKVIHTRHPGSTGVGKELRRIVKHSDYEIDMVTERMIMACDNCAFINMVLKPALSQNKIVIADRCNFISDYPYGLSAGVGYDEISRIHQVFVNPPKADLAILYRCDWEVAETRLAGDIEDGKQLQCRIESRGEDYFKKVIEYYDLMWSKPCGPCGCKKKLLATTLNKYVSSKAMIDASKPISDVESETIDYIDNALIGFE